jgi:ATP-dependent Lon protease
MKESARAGLSWVRTHVEELGIASTSRRRTSTCTCRRARCRRTVPSAGVAITVALVSLLTGRRVRGDVAMTGEITLRGTVLPVGGIKEKVLAAHRAGIKRVVLPDRNRKDIVDYPETIRQELELVFVKKIDEVLELTLENGAGRRPGPTLPAPVPEVTARA